MCSREIAFLKRHAGLGLDFQDIHKVALPAGYTQQQLLEVLHLSGADGHWYIGVDATVRAWSHTRYSWVVSPLRISWLRPFFDRCYAAWAKRRYCRLYQ
jgi:predicted DCC family thiol-disulfide oxidoreductase YuxK